jgi:hypothetical protein
LQPFTTTAAQTKSGGGAVEVDFEGGVGTEEGRIGMADGEFDGVGGVRCIAEILEDGEGGGELLGTDEEIDVG